MKRLLAGCDRRSANTSLRSTVLGSLRSSLTTTSRCASGLIRWRAGRAAAAPRTRRPTARAFVQVGRTVPVAFNTNTTTNAVNRTYAVPTFEAPDSSGGLADASVGYAGTQSDGLTMPDANHHLTFLYVRSGWAHRADRTRPSPERPARRAGAGVSPRPGDHAVAVAHDAAARSFEAVNRHYAAEWLRYDARLRRPASTTPAGMRASYESVNVVKASEDKTFPGERARLLPLRHQRAGIRGRLRGLLRARPDELPSDRRTVADNGHRLRPPVARPGWRARRGRDRERRPDHGGDLPASHPQCDLRPAPRARAGLGGPASRTIAVRVRFDDRVDRLRPDAAAVPVRRLRHELELGPDLQGAPGVGAQGDRHDAAARRLTGRDVGLGES